MATCYEGIRESREVFAEDIEEAVCQYLEKEGVFTRDELESGGMQYYDEKWGWTTTKTLKIRIRR